MPLSFEVDIFAYTEHLSLLKYDCTACEIEGQPYSLLHTVTPQDDLPPEERVQVIDIRDNSRFVEYGLHADSRKFFDELYLRRSATTNRFGIGN